MGLNKRTILISMIVMLFCITGTVNAAIQSSGGTPVKNTIGTWLTNIRKMESLGGGFGLSETINSDLTSSSESNNIDIHMEKNTEYGAMAILSASSYGNPNKINSGDTTTGNETGIVINLNKEWVSAGLNNMRDGTFKGADKRYKNIYTTTYVAKAGDAITETQRWHSSESSISNWIANAESGLIRTWNKSIFDYYGRGRYSTTQASYKTEAYYSEKWYTRAVVVCGEGV